MGRTIECGYTAIAQRREKIPKTRKQILTDENAWLLGWLYVENYKQFGATAVGAQGDKAGKASSDDHGMVYIYHATETVIFVFER